MDQNNPVRKVGALIAIVQTRTGKQYGHASDNSLQALEKAPSTTAIRSRSRAATR